MLFKSIGGRARPGACVALGVLLLAVLGTGNARAATTPAATGLTAPPGGVVDPNGRWWVSDHNAGFCRVSPPAGATPGTIEAATCLGGALADPPPRPGPASPGAPAFHDPTPGAPNSGDELVYVPDASTGSDKVMRLEWSPASGTFSLRDSITLLGGPDLRPTITALGTDGTLYVANGRSTTIQRVSAPASDAPTVAIVGTVDRALAMAAGEDAAGAVTLYFGEPAGITRLRPNAASPPASQPTAFDLGLVDAATPYEAGAMAYDAGARGLYAGTSVAAHAGSGVDKVVRFAIGSAGTGETVGTGFTGITGLDLGRGALAVFDGPVGDGKDNLSFVGDPRVAPFVGPLPAAAAGAAGATAGATGAATAGATGAATAGATLGAGRTVGRVTRV